MRIKRKEGKKEPVAAEPVVVRAKQPEEFWNFVRDGVTQSMLTNFLICPQKVRFRNIEGYSPVRSSSALEFGTLVHEVFDRVYGRHRDLQSGETASEELLPVGDFAKKAFAELYARDRKKLQEMKISGTAEQELELMYGLAEALLTVYFERFEKDFKSYKFRALEQIFDVPYVYPDGLTVRVRGKFDGVLEIRNKLWLFEHKTKGRIDEDAIVDRMAYDLQVMLYMWAMEQMYGVKPAGVIYNILRKPQLEQRTKRQPETLAEFLQRVQDDVRQRPDFYFIRYEANITKEETRDWRQEFDILMHRFREWESRRDYHRVSFMCSIGGLKCEMLPICARKDFTYFSRRKDVFPELTLGAE